MQNRYTGDMGDFGKYGLLKNLVRGEGGPDYRLGVFWYLYPDEKRKKDGKHTRYLNGSPKNLKRFRDCDSKLYDQLRAIVDGKRRAVKSVQEDGVLLGNTLFYDPKVKFDTISANSPAGRERRKEIRKQWLRAGVAALRKADLLFVDPDNGIECKSVKAHTKRGPKHVYLFELEKLWDKGRGPGLVIYHHLNRSASAEEQMQGQMKRLETHLKPKEGIFGLKWHPFSVRAYFVVPGAGQGEELRARARLLLASCWGNHFEGVGVE